MFQFLNEKQFEQFHHFIIPAIYTWGNKDKEKREIIRNIAQEGFPEKQSGYEWYGFLITIKIGKFRKPLDIENVPKLIIDAFSKWQINKDESKLPHLAIYEDDCFEKVRAVYVEGTYSLDNSEKTEVWIFGKNELKIPV